MNLHNNSSMETSTSNPSQETIQNNINGGSCCCSSSTPPPLTTPKSIYRSDNPNPHPTTFVQADTNNFKQVVQMLTGSSSSSETAKQNPITRGRSTQPIKTGFGEKKQSYKLYERRSNLKNGLSPLIPYPGRFAQKKSSFSPGKMSPSFLDFPALVLSPVTPLMIEDPFNKSLSPPSSSEEEKAIAEKKFYLHPSPRTNTPRGSGPQLLPLFPVISPRFSGLSS